MSTCGLLLPEGDEVIDFTICDKYGMYIWGKKNIYYAFEDGEFSYINRSMVPNISLSQAQLVYDLIKEEEKELLYTVTIISLSARSFWILPNGNENTYF